MNLREYLIGYTADQLKVMVRLCNIKYSATRKDEMIAQIAGALLSPEGAREQYEALDELSRKAVASAVYNEGEFDPAAFKAQYERLPESPIDPRTYMRGITGLELFLHGNHIPDDLLSLLRAWMPKPEPFRIPTVAKIPDDLEVFAEKIPLLCADTEKTGPQDLAMFLSLVERGEVALSSTNNMPTPAVAKRILSMLATGDYLPAPEKLKVAETIRPVGLANFARGSGLAELYRGQIKLTDAGREWLRTQDPELLLDGFEKWVHWESGDEIVRLSGVRGRASRNTRLNSPSIRRERIVEALSWCPTGEWIDIEDFFRAVVAWHFDFDVEATPDIHLYVGRSTYYSQYYGPDFDYWRGINGLYILAVLWEYLATIGALDIRYVEPENALYDAGSEYDDEDKYSQYDGLKYLRINPLGAYLFGQNATYVPLIVTRPPFLRVEAGDRICITAPDQAISADRLMLASFATPIDDNHYRLDLESLLTAVEKQQDLQAAFEYLERWHAGPLPAEIPALFEEAAARGEAFAAPQHALTIRARSRDLVSLVTRDEKLKTFCRQVDERTILLAENRLTAFRKRLRELGYVLPV